MAESDLAPLATPTRSGFVLHVERLHAMAGKVRDAAEHGDSLVLDADETRLLAATLRLLARRNGSGR